MFLMCCSVITSIMRCYASNLSQWLEDNPGLAAFIIALIPSLSAIFVFVFRPIIVEYNKRIVAEKQFYPKLRVEIEGIKRLLEENARLNILKKRTEYGNIYTPLYTRLEQRKFCREFKADDFKRELPSYQNKCDVIKSTIKESSEFNVPPKKTSRKEWFEKLQVLEEFCDYIISIKECECTSGSISASEVNGKMPHILKCEELLNAFCFFLEKLP